MFLSIGNIDRFKFKEKIKTIILKCFQKNVNMLITKKRRISLLLVTGISSNDLDRENSDEENSNEEH